MAKPVADRPRKIRFRPSAAMPLIRTRGQKQTFFEDVYHGILAMPWWRFFAYAAVGWVGINLVFAVLYAAAPG